MGSDAADVGAGAVAESDRGAGLDVGAGCGRLEGDVGAVRGGGFEGDAGACGGEFEGAVGAATSGAGSVAALALLAAIADVASARHTSAAWRNRVAVAGVTRLRRRPEACSRGRWARESTLR